MWWNRTAILLAIIFDMLPAYGAGDGIVQLIRSDNQEVILELSVAGFQAQPIEYDGTPYHRVTIPNFGLTTEVGHPQLPVRGEVIGVPEGARPVLEILAADFKVLSNYQILPVPRPEVDEEGTLSASLRYTFARVESIYQQDAFFPPEPVRVGFKGRMRDQAVMQILFYPIQTNPVRREVRFYNRILVRVAFQSIDSGSMSDNFALNKPQVLPKAGTGQIPVKGHTYERILENMLLNYPALGRR